MLPAYWPKENRFRAMLREGPPPMLMWITLDSVNLVEMMGAYGVDAVIIDCEHTATTLEDAQNKIVAAELAGMTTFVRPSQVDIAETGRLLTLGAQGVVYSMISNEDDARNANRAVFYPPRGERGFAGPHGRYARWSGNQVVNADPERKLFSNGYIQAANDALATIYCVENDEGLENLEKIIEIGKPDGVMFGIGDYMVSVGFDQAKVAAAKRKMYDICRSNGVGIALNAVPADDLEYYQGCFFTGGVEATVLSDAMYSRVKGVRDRIRELGLSS
ncbi:MAG TPA: aldolase/citrate lyase family protein [Jatrophihabitantaceae bacterium]|jgi:4-hydroxy-2-oxoheptanedioate aldolase|nr:aldolase/citrate lyase family protein [Jatrophihabitantaceae bacterium]